MKLWKKIVIFALIFLVIAGGVSSILVFQSKGYFAPGNDEQYSVEQTRVMPDSAMTGKTIVFLGSSVTQGSASKGESFVEYLEKRDGIIPIKEAVPGTTLVDKGKKSYIKRLMRLNREMKVDAFVCQLSTNDATKKMPLGEISGSFNLDEFDTSTVAGAIEYIICYAQNIWECPVAFYTNTKYNSTRYGEMVELLKEIAEKWDIYVINMWDDEIMSSVPKADRELYMVDSIHPSRAGYQLWWTPRFEVYLKAKLDDNYYVQKKDN
ncbi:MAG: SGNH/GDSL hydrolase family protein [Eubacterium sp.]|nr:SGNH/GDSL hydrolase family protein [Eubacterium sp.]